MADYSYTSTEKDAQGNKVTYREVSHYDPSTRTTTYTKYDSSGKSVGIRTVQNIGGGQSQLRTYPYYTETKKSSQNTGVDNIKTAESLVNNLPSSVQLRAVSSKAQEYGWIKNYSPFNQSIPRVINPQETITSQDGYRFLFDPTSNAFEAVARQEAKVVSETHAIEEQYPAYGSKAPLRTVGRYYGLQGGLFLSGLGRGVVNAVNPFVYLSSAKNVVVNPVNAFVGMRESFQYNPAGFYGELGGQTIVLSGASVFAKPFVSTVKPIVKPFFVGNKQTFIVGTEQFLKYGFESKSKQFAFKGNVPFELKSTTASVFGGFKKGGVDVFGNPISDVRLDIGIKNLDKNYAPYGMPRIVGGETVSVEYNTLYSFDKKSFQTRLNKPILYYELKNTRNANVLNVFGEPLAKDYIPTYTADVLGEGIIQKHYDILGYHGRTATQLSNEFRFKGNKRFVLDSKKNFVANPLQADLFGNTKIVEPINKGFLAKEGFRLDFIMPKGNLFGDVNFNYKMNPIAGNEGLVIESTQRQLMPSYKSLHYAERLNPRYDIYDFINPWNNRYVENSRQSLLFPLSNKKSNIVSRNVLKELYGKKESNKIMSKEVSSNQISNSLIIEKLDIGIPKRQSISKISSIYANDKSLNPISVADFDVEYVPNRKIITYSEHIKDNGLFLNMNTRLGNTNKVLYSSRFSNILSLNNKNILRTKQDNILLSLSLQSQKNILLPIQNIKNNQVLRQAQEQMQQQRQSQLQISKMKPVSNIGGVRYNYPVKPVEVLPKESFVINSFSSFKGKDNKGFRLRFNTDEFGIHKKVVSTNKRISLKFGYFPSLEAELFHVHGRQPKGWSSGLVMRPL